MAKFNLRQYAVHGARARASELEAELKEIYKVFPELRGTKGRAAASEAGGRRRRRRRSNMTAAQRKAVSDRMKKYWTGRRKAKS